MPPTFPRCHTGFSVTIIAAPLLRLAKSSSPVGFHLLSRLAHASGTAASGHEGRFAPPSLSAGYEFRKETIAGTHGNERDEPIPAVRRTAIEPRDSTLSRPIRCCSCPVFGDHRPHGCRLRQPPVGQRPRSASRGVNARLLGPGLAKCFKWSMN
jgi:hypothetical protein